jgi:hypothetical protein
MIHLKIVWYIHMNIIKHTLQLLSNNCQSSCILFLYFYACTVHVCCFNENNKNKAYYSIINHGQQTACKRYNEVAVSG